MTEKMTVNFNPQNNSFWHINCDRTKQPPKMRIIEIDVVDEQTLMECVYCGKRGNFPNAKGNCRSINIIEPENNA